MGITYLNTKRHRVLHICFAGRSGGAHASAFRLHIEHSKLENIDSHFLDSDFNIIDSKLKMFLLSKTLLFFNVLNSLVLRLIRKKSIPFSLRLFRIKVENIINFVGYDCVYIHWLGRSVCLATNDLKVLQKVILVHRDYQFITSGCHYPIDCKKMPNCIQCPAVSNFGNKLLSPPITCIDKVKANFFIGKQMLDSVHWLTQARCIGNICELNFLDHVRNGNNAKKSIFKIGFVAGNVFSFEKGFDILISALKQPALCKKNIEVHAFGKYSIPEAQRVKNNFQQIHFRGRLEFDALSKAYCECDLVVVPSRNEAFGKVSVESQMSGTPVVVSSDTGLTDTLIDRITGRVFKNGCSESLASEINSSLDELDLLINNILNNREFYKRFSAKSIAISMLNK